MCVLGLGKSGTAAAALAAARGAAVVVGADARADAAPLHLPPRYEGTVCVESALGEQVSAEALARADVVVLSPGVPPDAPAVEAARAAGVIVYGELGFAAETLPAGLPLVAVTGTNGKSTVTTFAGQLLEAVGARCWVGGNLGVPLSALAEELWLQGDQAAVGAYEAAVVEVSSYQLQTPGTLAPAAAAILNVTPDHLARHGTMEAYAEAKLNVFGRMGPGNVTVVPAADGALIAKAAARAPGAAQCLLGVCEDTELVTAPGAWLTRSGHKAVVRLPEGAGRPALGADLLMEVALDGLRTVGRHNRANAASACLLAATVSPAARDAAALSEAMRELEPPPHRMEVVGVGARDVLWINDSKATNVESTIAGVGGLDRKAVVLLGGEAKEDASGALGMERLMPALQFHDCVVTFGASGPKIAAELRAAGMADVLQPQDDGGASANFDEAATLHPAAGCTLLELAPGATLAKAAAAGQQAARDGGALVLSPACASFDQFDNFEHRGRVFQELLG